MQSSSHWQLTIYKCCCFNKLALHLEAIVDVKNKSVFLVHVHITVFVHYTRTIVSNYIKTIEKGTKNINSTTFEPGYTTTIIQTFHFFLQ